MPDPRVKVFSTKDGKRVLTIRFVDGKPRAWITDHASDFQAQHEFSEGIEEQLCDFIFNK